MIDYTSHTSQLSRPSGAEVSAAAAARCYGNCHGVTSCISTSSDIGDNQQRVHESGYDVDRATVVPPTCCDVISGSTPTVRSPGSVDDCDVAADAEVCWLLRYATAVAPEVERAFGCLNIETPLMACVAPDLDCLPTVHSPCSGVRLPSRTLSHSDSVRRPYLNFDKMQVQ